MANRLLLVDDDVRLATALSAALVRAGFDVRHAPTARAALAAPPVDLVLLDLTLPDGDGLEVCRRLRRRREVGIIVLTARRAPPEIVAGLRSGADDYVVKPFGFAELRARIEAVLRRVRSGPAGTYRRGDLVVDLDEHRAEVAGAPLSLTRTEFRLLTALVRRPDGVTPRESLLAETWPGAPTRSSRTLDVHMAALRAKVGAPRIQTLRGVGYRLLPLTDRGPGPA